MNDMNRKQRRAARTEGHLDSAAFLKLADKFIDVANQQNKRVNATQVHLACLYASARYSAYVANTILGVPNHEDFVRERRPSTRRCCASISPTRHWPSRLKLELGRIERRHR